MLAPMEARFGGEIRRALGQLAGFMGSACDIGVLRRGGKGNGTMTGFGRIGAALCLAACLWGGPAAADGERAGAFDYYVLALSWMPSFCTLEGDAKGDARCGDEHAFGFVLHGLWPQNEVGWPSFCRTGARDPSRAETRRQAGLFGAAGLAWHQWKKHGRCSGLSAPGYFALAREAFERIERPEIFRRLPEPVRLPPAVVEAAFLEANPGLEAQGVTVTCRDGLVQEVRICLSRGLSPRACSGRVARDCPAEALSMAPIR